MLTKTRNSLSKLLRESLPPEFTRISTLHDDVGSLHATVTDYQHHVQSLESDVEALKLLAGRVLVNQMKQHGIYDSIQEAEFRVFSQFGDDGIIQYLIHHVKPEPQTFIEFGTQNYRESNTRFLLMNNNWKGLIVEGDARCIEFVKQDPIYWRYDLTAVNRFIDKDNINQIFTEHGFRGEIGLLSIDIDGNDYWVWESIDSVNPAIVIVEYNSVFGRDRAITVPYDAGFHRTRAHYSNLFWGCSLKALCLLAAKKGYVFVGTNSNGNNAHFVRRDQMANLRAIDISRGYTESKFRESRDERGNLTYLSGDDRLRAIRELSVYDVESGTVETIERLFGL